MGSENQDWEHRTREGEKKRVGLESMKLLFWPARFELAALAARTSVFPHLIGYWKNRPATSRTFPPYGW